MRLQDALERLARTESAIRELKKDDYGGLARAKGELDRVIRKLLEPREWEPRLREIPHEAAKVPSGAMKYVNPLIARRWESGVERGISTCRDATAKIRDLEGAVRLLHPTVQRAAAGHFHDGDYRVAAFEAQVALSTALKNAMRHKGLDPKDDQGLLDRAFKAGVFTLPHDEKIDKGIPEGYVMIFRGAYQAIRNPKGHERFEISADRCLHFLFLSSLMLAKCDEAGVDTRV